MFCNFKYMNHECTRPKQNNYISGKRVPKDCSEECIRLSSPFLIYVWERMPEKEKGRQRDLKPGPRGWHQELLVTGPNVRMKTVVVQGVRWQRRKYSMW